MYLLRKTSVQNLVLKAVTVYFIIPRKQFLRVSIKFICTGALMKVLENLKKLLITLLQLMLPQ